VLEFAILLETVPCVPLQVSQPLTGLPETRRSAQAGLILVPGTDEARQNIVFIYATMMQLMQHNMDLQWIMLS